MAKVFVSFLGIGTNKKKPGYDEAEYSWPGKSDSSVKTHFALGGPHRWASARPELLDEGAHDGGHVDAPV